MVVVVAALRTAKRLLVVVAEEHDLVCLVVPLIRLLLLVVRLRILHCSYLDLHRLPLGPQSFEGPAIKVPRAARYY